jgi:hypothetical protein
MSDDIDLNRAFMYCVAVGFVVGIIASVPVLRLPNICCLWIIAGGFAAVYLSGADVKNVEFVDAAVVGGMFGGVYGIVVNIATFLINIPLNLLGLGSSVRGTTGSGLLDRLGVHLGIAMVGDIAVVVVNVIIGIIFGAVGGLLYIALIDERGASKPSGLIKPSTRTTLGKR